MFGKFFDIDESAFSIAPNPKYLYLSKQHEEALAHLVYGVTRKSGFVCLTGDIGAGKTTICRCMLEQLPENTEIAFVVNPKVSPLELLSTICDELNLNVSPQQIGINEYVKKIHAYLIKAHAQGQNTVLVIDEAQNLSVDALEHVRALTNLETNDQKLLQIILIGQPELKKLLAKPELEQVNQRITARFHIGPLSLNETNYYINHRLLVAGAKKKIFSAENIKQIFKYTKGVPRRINILCDRVLLGAYTIRNNKITSKVIRQSAEEVFDTAPLYKDVTPKALAASVFALLISGALVFSLLNNSDDIQPVGNKLSALPEKNSTIKDSSLAVKNVTEDLAEAELNKELGAKSTVAMSVTPVVEKQVIEKKTSYVAKVKNQLVAADDIEPIKSQMANIKLNSASKLQPKTQVKIRSEPRQEISAKKALANSKPADESKDKQGLQFTSYGKAYQQLFALWGISYSSSDATPCEHAAYNLLECYQTRGGIKKVIRLNRPVLLKSKNAESGHNYIVVVSIEGNHAVINEKGDYQSVAISEIEENWSGEFELLWRPLKTGVTNIFPGQSGETVALLDAKLAKFQGRESSTPHPFVYSNNLVDQVRAFQLANNLPADGVVGPITQMYFNYSESQSGNSGELEIPLLVK